MEKETQRFEAQEKPEIESLMDVIPDTQNFNEPERAEAIIKNLSLSVGDVIRESDDGEEYTINPKMVLRGHAPSDYEKELRLFKELCTPLMIEQMTAQIKYKKEFGDKQRGKFYNSFCNKLDRRLKIKSLLESEAVKYFTQENSFKNTVAGLHNCVHWMLDVERDLNEFVLAWENKPIPNTQTWSEENDGEYRVLTDSEADRAVNDYLTDDEELWKMAVESGNTTLGIDAWAEQVMSYDGRGQTLASYDSCEEYEDVNETTYYIYRTN